MEISPAVELAHITYPLLADVASEEVEMKERLQFLVNLLHQYLHSFQGKKGEKSFLQAKGTHVGKRATDIASATLNPTNNQTTYRSCMMID